MIGSRLASGCLEVGVLVRRDIGNKVWGNFCGGFMGMCIVYDLLSCVFYIYVVCFVFFVF